MNITCPVTPWIFCCGHRNSYATGRRITRLMTPTSRIGSTSGLIDYQLGSRETMQYGWHVTGNYIEERARDAIKLPFKSSILCIGKCLMLEVSGEEPTR